MSRLRALWSIRTILLLVFPIGILCLVAITGVSVWLINYANTSNSVYDLSLTLQSEIAQRIKIKCENQLNLAPQLVRVIQSNILYDNWNLTSFAQMQPVMWKYFAAFPEISWLNMASTLEQYWAYERVANNSVNYHFKDERTGADRITFAVDSITGLPIPNWGPVAVRKGYLPSARGWWKDSVRMEEGWIPPYFFSNGDIGMSRGSVLRSISRSSQMVGVTTVDFTLQGLNSFLRNISISPNGKAFIAMKSGELIAASAGSINDYFGTGVMTPAQNSSDPIIASVSRQILIEYGGFHKIFGKNVDEHERSKFSVGNANFFVKIVDFPYDQALNWIIVVIIPESDVLSTVQQLTVTTMSVTGAVMFVSLFFTIVFSASVGFCISKPLSNVSSHMKQVTDINFSKSKPGHFSSLYEFTEIERALQILKGGLDQYSSIVPLDMLKHIGITQYSDIRKGLVKKSEWTVLVLKFKYNPSANQQQNITINLNNEMNSEQVSSNQMIAMASNYFAAVNTLLEKINPVFKQNSSLFVNFESSGVTAVFSTASDALHCALELSQMISEFPIAIGIHSGSMCAGFIGVSSNRKSSNKNNKRFTISDSAAHQGVEQEEEEEEVSNSQQKQQEIEMQQKEHQHLKPIMLSPAVKAAKYLCALALTKNCKILASKQVIDAHKSGEMIIARSVGDYDLGNAVMCGSYNNLAKSYSSAKLFSNIVPKSPFFSTTTPNAGNASPVFKAAAAVAASSVGTPSTPPSANSTTGLLSQNQMLSEATRINFEKNVAKGSLDKGTRGNQTIAVFEIINNIPIKLDTRDVFTRAVNIVNQYDGDYNEARQLLEQVLEQDPKDQFALEKLEEVKQYIDMNNKAQLEMPLEDTLNEAVLAEAFKTMCKVEYTIENVNALFLLQKIMGEEGIEERTRLYELFYNSYISHDAKFAMNIQDHTREYARKILEDPASIANLKMLEVLLNEIQFLLFDTYKRFKTSKYYYNAFQKSEKKKRIAPRKVDESYQVLLD